MKISLGKKSLLVLIASASMLAAYNKPSNSQNAPLSSSQSPVENTTSENSQVPEHLTGTYDLSDGSCGADTMTISSKALNSDEDNEEVAVVKEVTSGDGYYDVTYEATEILSDEEDPSDNLMKVRLAPLSGGEGLTVQELDVTTDALTGETETLKKCG